MNSNGKRIVVTGGAGFIGSHVVDAYIAKGHRVAVIDDLSKGSRKNLHPQAVLYKADIRDLAAMKRIFKKERSDIVNHHAAVISVAESMRDPASTLRTNVEGTANVLIAAGEAGVKRALFVSSAAVYGDPAQLPLREDAPIAPISPYGLSKAMGEQVVEFYARMYGFDHLIFRYANVYGPRQDANGEGGVVAIFGDRMRRGIRPTIFGDGTKTRDYVYVADVAKANVLGLAKRASGVVNIGRCESVTDRHVFDAIARATGFAGESEHAPLRQGDIMHSLLSFDRALDILGWKPTYGFDAGIRVLYRHIRSGVR